MLIILLFTATPLVISDSFISIRHADVVSVNSVVLFVVLFAFVGLTCGDCQAEKRMPRVTSVIRPGLTRLGSIMGLRALKGSKQSLALMTPNWKNSNELSLFVITTHEQSSYN